MRKLISSPVEYCRLHRNCFAIAEWGLQPRMKSATQDKYWPDRLGSRTGGYGATVHNGLEKIWVAPSVWPMAILVCSVWRIPIFRSVRSGQYSFFGLFGLANTHILVCSVWPIPKFRPVRSGQYPNFGLFGLANTHILVCSVWPIPKFRSVRSSQYLISRLRSPAK